MLNPELFILPHSEIKMYGQENLTYGSLTIKGINTIIKYIKKYKISNNIYGFDLGCGDGELIYNLEQLIKNSIWEGVEISDYRISLQTKDVHIWQGDMLMENFRPYNVLHADNLCLDDNTLDKLEEKISIEFIGIYITYKYPENILFLKKAIFLETVMTETTWTIHPIHFFMLE
jgi:hypothetical protein